MSRINEMREKKKKNIRCLIFILLSFSLYMPLKAQNEEGAKKGEFSKALSISLNIGYSFDVSAFHSIFSEEIQKNSLAYVASIDFRTTKVLSIGIEGGFYNLAHLNVDSVIF